MSEEEIRETKSAYENTKAEYEKLEEDIEALDARIAGEKGAVHKEPAF